MPRNLCFEVKERLDAGGEVLEPPDEDRVHEIARTLAERDIVSVAVCLLHGYLNPVHERRIGEVLRTHNQELVISLSSEVCPEFREYFRASTIIINACVRPVLASYLDDIESRLRGRGMTAELLIMRSSGGVLAFETGAEKPACMVESGGAATADTLATLRERFHTDHDRSYGHGYPDQPTELVDFRLSALGSIRKPRLREITSPSGRASDARKSVRQVHFDVAGGFVETPVYDRARLGTGQRFDGPAIVEEMDSTTLLLPDYTVEVDRYANLLISPAG